MHRTLFSEELDFLPIQDQRAMSSRRDRRRINACMGNIRWWRRSVAQQIKATQRVLEIGPDETGFQLLPDHHVAGLDRASAPAAWPPETRWFDTATQERAGWEEFDAVIGSFVFYHFSHLQLRQLGGRITPQTRIIAACEPRRARRFQIGFALLARALGACAVTRRDGHVSIFAGFRGDELPHALGLDPHEWRWSVEETWRGAYRMIAVKRP